MQKTVVSTPRILPRACGERAYVLLDVSPVRRGDVVFRLIANIPPPVGAWSVARRTRPCSEDALIGVEDYLLMARCLPVRLLDVTSADSIRPRASPSG